MLNNYKSVAFKFVKLDYYTIYTQDAEIMNYLCNLLSI